MSNENTFLFIWIRSLTKIYSILNHSDNFSYEYMYDDQFIYRFFICHFNLCNEDNLKENLSLNKKLLIIQSNLQKAIDQFGFLSQKYIKSIFLSFHKKESKGNLWKLIFTLSYIEGIHYLAIRNKTKNQNIIHSVYDNYSNVSNQFNFITNQSIPTKLKMVSILQSTLLIRNCILIAKEVMCELDVEYQEIENVYKESFTNLVNDSVIEEIFSPDTPHHQQYESQLNSNNISFNYENENHFHNNNEDDVIFIKTKLDTSQISKSKFILEDQHQDEQVYSAKCMKCEINDIMIETLNKDLLKEQETNANLKETIEKTKAENATLKESSSNLQEDIKSLKSSIKKNEKIANLIKTQEKNLNEITLENEKFKYDIRCKSEEIEYLKCKIDQYLTKISNFDELNFKLKRMEFEFEKINKLRERSKSFCIDKTQLSFDNNSMNSDSFQSSFFKIENMNIINSIKDPRRRSLDSAQTDRKNEEYEKKLKTFEKKIETLKSTIHYKNEFIKRKEKQIKSLNFLVEKYNSKVCFYHEISNFMLIVFIGIVILYLIYRPAI